MFQQRQMNEVWPLVEESYSTSTVSPGAVANGQTVVFVAAVPCSLGAPGGGGTSAATFAVGDTLEVVAPASAALNGILVSAAPNATPGSCTLYFTNGTAGSVTPVAAIYKIIAKRQVANVVS